MLLPASYLYVGLNDRVPSQYPLNTSPFSASCRSWSFPLSFWWKNKRTINMGHWYSVKITGGNRHLHSDDSPQSSSSQVSSLFLRVYNWDRQATLLCRRIGRMVCHTWRRATVKCAGILSSSSPPCVHELNFNYIIHLVTSKRHLVKANGYITATSDADESINQELEINLQDGRTQKPSGSHWSWCTWPLLLSFFQWYPRNLLPHVYPPSSLSKTK